MSYWISNRKYGDILRLSAGLLMRIQKGYMIGSTRYAVLQFMNSRNQRLIETRTVQEGHVVHSRLLSEIRVRITKINRTGIKVRIKGKGTNIGVIKRT